MGKTRKVDLDEDFEYDDLRQMKKVVKLQREDRHKREIHASETSGLYREQKLAPGKGSTR